MVSTIVHPVPDMARKAVELLENKRGRDRNIDDSSC